VLAIAGNDHNVRAWSDSEASRKQDVSAPEGGDSHGSTEPILVGSGVGDPMWPLTRAAI
jgi:hypothetical protein